MAKTASAWPWPSPALAAVWCLLCHGATLRTPPTPAPVALFGPLLVCDVLRIARQDTPPLHELRLSWGAEASTLPSQSAYCSPEEGLQKRLRFAEDNRSTFQQSLSAVSVDARAAAAGPQFVRCFCRSPLHGNINRLKTRSHQSPVAEADLRDLLAPTNSLLRFATCLPFQADHLACTADSSGLIGTRRTSRLSGSLNRVRTTFASLLLSCFACAAIIPAGLLMSSL